MDKYNQFVDKEYYHIWESVNTKEKITFYYYESNNCRKFWIDSSKNTFNYNYKAGFILTCNI